MAEMVTVGCKLPNGLVLEVGPERVQVAGWRNNAVKIVGGYGLTQVEKAFWEAWLAEHCQQPYVKNGVIFAQDKANSAAAQATEQKTVKSGLEPLPQKNPAPGINRDDEVMDKPQE
ncbi:hypothetical protein LWV02_002840 [Salmonella enterica]|uniref:Uncharacterized protein n=1 Tax=Salmonella hadar TaxID=149385 RepID=A0A5Y2N355_SALHA|nr:hypothetical protein [Salmonella enterica]EAA5552893.1 hypothetical protein [Salmonella enterica subsp. enterica serovar Cotham]EAB9315121.1 hypothetical protein [Salmonella enterica subsp. enterica serovar Typhimurium]EAC0780116.1 hypothetical protein [Salmonella enterica subsp. enterica serovar Aba]EBQ9004439.1 hypothetical protein [Salmonella enterica subsp. enterica serovar Blockley]EBV0565153.1 hypothetical protein [Salmonella enterica subsp. enterica serovar Rissen]EBX0326310.1 hypot